MTGENFNKTRIAVTFLPAALLSGESVFAASLGLLISGVLMAIRRKGKG